MKKLFKFAATAAATATILSGCSDLSAHQQHQIEVQTFKEHGPKMTPFRH